MTARQAFLSAALAAILAVAAVVLPVTIASAAAASAAGTRVGAHDSGMIFGVGGSARVCAGEGRDDAVSQPVIVVGACVAAEDGEDTADSCLVGGSSFTAGTKVLLASGAAVPISQLKPGDKVLATSTRTGKTQPEAVAAVLVHHDTDLYDLTVQAGRRTALIDTTSNHLFWVPGTGGHGGRWAKAGTLKYGAHLRTPSGSDIATILGGWVPRQRDGWMWDLTVPGNNDHDFYINTTAAAVLVHNIDCEQVAQQTLGPDSGSGVSLARGDSISGEEQALINESGDANGCSTCGADESGWKDGNWTGDHQPPYKLAPDGPWTGYPQCAACSRQQGGIVNAILNEWYDFDPEP